MSNLMVAESLRERGRLKKRIGEKRG